MAGVIGGYAGPGRSTTASGIVEEPGAFFADVLAKVEPADFVGTYLVLVNANNRYNAVDADMVAMVRRLYLRDETAWPDSFNIDPFGRLGGSDAQRAFRALVLGMTHDEEGAHWRRLNAASGEAPPKVFFQPRDLVRAIAKHKGGLGVVAAWEVSKLPAKVRVLFAFSARERPDGATVSIERLFWEAIKEGTDPTRFETYLSTFPDGAFAELARARFGEFAATATGEAIETALVTPDATTQQETQTALLATPPEPSIVVDKAEVEIDDRLKSVIREHFKRLGLIENQEYLEIRSFQDLFVKSISGTTFIVDIRYRASAEIGYGKTETATVKIE